MRAAAPDPAFLSAHLSVAEFLSTRHAWAWPEQHEQWAGTPAIRDNARRLAESVFEPIRAMVGRLHVNSGFRSAHLNAEVGGRSTSRHVLGLAVDVVPLDASLRAAMDTITRALDAGGLQELDEAIEEMGWLHLQAAPLGSAPRRLVLATADGVKFRPYERRIA